jgi:autotransporter-associated beta strand protein
LNISAGSVSVTNNLTMGATTLRASNAATANINITGTGTLTVGGNIQYTNGLGTETNTVTLNGGTLDLTDGNLGASGALITFNAQAGTLRNLAELNGGGTLTKTTAGTLLLDTANSYTGLTTISAGVLVAAHATALGTSAGATSVTSDAELRLQGGIAIASEALTLNGTGSTDANSDALTYRWTLTSKPASSTAALSSATVASPTLTADLAGSYVASLVVNDGKLDSTNTSTVTVTAAAANAAPVANAGSVQTVSRSSGTITVTLNATGSTDANGDTLTYRWAVAYQPPTSSITLSSTTTASPTFAATVAGVYVFTLVVNDGKIDSAAATVSITVN